MKTIVTIVATDGEHRREFGSDTAALKMVSEWVCNGMMGLAPDDVIIQIQFEDEKPRTVDTSLNKVIDDIKAVVHGSKDPDTKVADIKTIIDNHELPF